MSETESGHSFSQKIRSYWNRHESGIRADVTAGCSMIGASEIYAGMLVMMAGYADVGAALMAAGNVTAGSTLCLGKDTPC